MSVWVFSVDLHFCRRLNTNYVTRYNCITAAVCRNKKEVLGLHKETASLKHEVMLISLEMLPSVRRSTVRHEEN